MPEVLGKPEALKGGVSMLRRAIRWTILLIILVRLGCVLIDWERSAELAKGARRVYQQALEIIKPGPANAEKALDGL